MESNETNANKINGTLIENKEYEVRREQEVEELSAHQMVTRTGIGRNPDAKYLEAIKPLAPRMRTLKVLKNVNQSE